ncbi:hypothetical protein TNCV_5132421 [Trichonephila clavipes]|nr:hypothetical protein TNCV_5132421 [Trichonephila clavipes]
MSGRAGKATAAVPRYRRINCADAKTWQDLPQGVVIVLSFVRPSSINKSAIQIIGIVDSPFTFSQLYNTYKQLQSEVLRAEKLTKDLKAQIETEKILRQQTIDTKQARETRREDGVLEET